MSGEFTPTINDADLLTQGYTPAAIEEFHRWVDELPPEVFAAARAEGAAAERDACAQVAGWSVGDPRTAENIAAAIRARSGDGDPHATRNRRVLLTHPHDGHGEDGTCIECAEFRAGERP